MKNTHRNSGFWTATKLFILMIIMLNAHRNICNVNIEINMNNVMKTAAVAVAATTTTTTTMLVEMEKGEVRRHSHWNLYIFIFILRIEHILQSQHEQRTPSRCDNWLKTSTNSERDGNKAVHPYCTSWFYTFIYTYIWLENDSFKDTLTYCETDRKTAISNHSVWIVLITKYTGYSQ